VEQNPVYQKPVALILPRTNPQRCPIWKILKVSRVRRVKNRITIKAKITREARARKKGNKEKRLE
jgi:hypothetical protein